jgi:hypothetical protein
MAAGLMRQLGKAVGGVMAMVAGLALVVLGMRQDWSVGSMVIA